MFTSVCTLVYPPLPVSGYTCEPTGARVCAPGEHTPESAAAAPADVKPMPTTARDTAAVTTVLSRRRLSIRELLSAEAVDRTFSVLCHQHPNQRASAGPAPATPAVLGMAGLECERACSR